MPKESKALKNKPLIFFLSILAAITIGISSAAILNLQLHFFFYCTFFGSMLAGLSCSIFLVVIDKRSILKMTDTSEELLSKVLAITVATVITFSFLSTIPLNIDRSFSVWILNKISSDPALNSQAQIEKQAELFFSAKSGEILRRVNEQERLGNIKRVNGVITMTKKGNLQVRIDRFIRDVFHLNNKYAG